MITIKVPATSANIGSGFDTLGLAVDMYNIIEIEKSDKPGFELINEGDGKELLSTGKDNIVYKSMVKVFDRVGEHPDGYRVTLTNNVPLSRGLGSSSAAIVGGLVMGNVLTGEKLSDNDILEMATEIEGHPDNVAPAVFGGIVVSCIEGKNVIHIKLDVPQGLKSVVAVPDFHLETEKARSVLPSEVPFKDAVFNVSRLGVLIAGFATGDISVLDTATQDRLHQDYRKSLIPGIDDVFKEAKKAGAKSVTLSGAGPSILALTSGNEEKIAEAMEKAFAAAGIKSKAHIMDLCSLGYQVTR